MEIWFMISYFYLKLWVRNIAVKLYLITPETLLYLESFSASYVSNDALSYSLEERVLVAIITSVVAPTLWETSKTIIHTKGNICRIWDKDAVVQLKAVVITIRNLGS